MTKNEEKITNQLLRFDLTKDEIDGLSLKKAISYIRFYHENKFNSRIFGNATLLSAFHPFESKYIEMARDYRDGNDSRQGAPRFKDSYDLLNNEFLYDFSVPIEFRIAKPLSNFDKDVLIKSFSFESEISYKVNLHKMTCSCPDYEKKLRSQYSKGDIRRLCKHLMFRYKNNFGLYGLSEFLDEVFNDGYPLKKNLREVHLENYNHKIFVSYDNNIDWWAVYVQDENGEYFRCGYTPIGRKFIFNRKKPVGIVMLLKEKFKEIHKELEGNSHFKPQVNRIIDRPQKESDLNTKNDGCVFLVSLLIIAWILSLIF
jgi:hypothetical protein